MIFKNVIDCLFVTSFSGNVMNIFAVLWFTADWRPPVAGLSVLHTVAVSLQGPEILGSQLANAFFILMDYFLNIILSQN